MLIEIAFGCAFVIWVVTIKYSIVGVFGKFGISKKEIHKMTNLSKQGYYLLFKYENLFLSTIDDIYVS